ncbi:MAG TPA: hypothetical protein VIF40_03665 [Methylosinus sp.]|jgi:hypothetical protein|uniref:hypothetical protein n=1 Tax=Methylosinus sp. TaxID=427 RepID=UPI002F936261
MTEFKGNHIQWPIERNARTFTARVVEPIHYDPKTHKKIFDATMTHLIMPPENDKIDKYDNIRKSISTKRVDLITFPEAFIDPDTLLQALTTIKGIFTCVHVGLRIGYNSEYLFSTRDLLNLIESIEQVKSIYIDDIQKFKSWITSQRSDEMFNVGCVFAIDKHNKLRVCIHPKIVRSIFEFSPSPENHMSEANLLNLITLRQSKGNLKNIVMQPLLCSDATTLQTDKGMGGPIELINKIPTQCFDGDVPDHIDIVSVSTCTPQVKNGVARPSIHREWHRKFLDSFQKSADDFHRHHFSVFVLANFHDIKIEDGDSVKMKDGGLSGVFIPVPPPKNALFPSGIDTSCWGRPKNKDESQNNSWSRPDDDALTKWSSMGFICMLSPISNKQGIEVRVLECTIHRLPRDNSLWSNFSSIEKCVIYVGRQADGGEIRFAKQEAQDAE